MTEVGPVSYPVDGSDPMLGVLEDHYFAEVIDTEQGVEVDDGATGELVLTTLERDGCPLLRYRTGDLVRKRLFRDPDRGLALGLAGGMLGRLDDMVVVRGVNIFPSGVEAVVHRHPEVAEYEVRMREVESMAEIEVAVEVAPGTASPDAVAEEVAEDLRGAFGLRVPTVLAHGLPRYEFKASRWKKLA
jgi:phenylacetate-CoA ligase